MNKKIGHYRHSIFYRLIFVFLISLLPMYLLSIGIHRWGVTIIQREITKSMSFRLEYQKMIIDNELALIRNLQSEFFSNEDLLMLSVIPQYLTGFEKVQSMNRLQNSLYLLKNSSIYIDDAIAIMPQLDRAISANSGVRPISSEDAMIMEAFPENSMITLINRNNELFSITRNIMHLSRQSNINCVLQISISNSMLDKTLASFGSHEGGELILYYPDQDFHIGVEDNSEILTHLKHTVDGLEGSYLESIDVGNDSYYFLYEPLSHGTMWLVAYIPKAAVFSPLSGYNYIIWILTVVSLFIIIYVSFSTHRFLQKPLLELITAFKSVETGDRNVFIQHKSDDEFHYLYTRFNAMLEHINYLIDQVYTQKIMNQKAELKHLQSQINPHFLYNSFFILQRMMQADESKNAVKFCSYLGKYFRYITRNAQNEVCLEEEVEHARNYLEIQAIRFSNALITCGELPSKFKDLLIPRLILQPIIENAFEHGLSRRTSQAELRVSFAEADEGIFITVEDNGENADIARIEACNRELSSVDDGEAEITGLKNINKRVKLKLGENSGLSVSRGELGGWKAVLFLETGGR